MTSRPPNMIHASQIWSLQKAAIDGTIFLPQIDRLSKMSQNLEPLFCNQHPNEDDQYPLIIENSKPTRSRVLALGGPYE